MTTHPAQVPATSADDDVSVPASSNEAIELMRHLSQLHRDEDRPATDPTLVFTVLTEKMGYYRTDGTIDDSQVEEFVDSVRAFLSRAKRNTPTYDEVLATMRELGYSRDRNPHCG